METAKLGHISKYSKELDLNFGPERKGEKNPKRLRAQVPWYLAWARSSICRWCKRDEDEIPSRPTFMYYFSEGIGPHAFSLVKAQEQAMILQRSWLQFCIRSAGIFSIPTASLSSGSPNALTTSPHSSWCASVSSLTCTSILLLPPLVHYTLFEA